MSHVHATPAALPLGRAIAALMMLCLLTPPLTSFASAQTSQQAAQTGTKSMKIQNVRSPGGIEAWLVESHNVPLMALRFSFSGGNAQDPAGKEGLANFITAMMDEGAGDLDSQAFQERMEEIAMRMSFEDSRDHLYGNFETLTVNRAKAIELLRLALTRPRFDADAVERIRKQLLSNLAFAAKDPNRVANKAFSAMVFPGHPYGRPAEGTPETIATVKSADLEAYRKRVFAKSTLKVVAVGDIDAGQLGLMLDKVFGDLPAKAELVPVARAKIGKGRTEVIEMPIPQSVATFGLPGLLRQDPDYMAATVMNQILGGGGFASRLMEEVREKRGLAYSVYTYLHPLKEAGLFAGGVATKNEEIGQSLDVIKAEMRRMAAEGPSATELENARSYLTGSYALRFDTNAKIASQLLAIMIDDLGVDYVDKRNAEIDVVTLADVRRIATKLLRTEEMFVTVVGKPQGVRSEAPAKGGPRG